MKAKVIALFSTINISVIVLRTTARLIVRGVKSVMRWIAMASVSRDNALSVLLKLWTDSARSQLSARIWARASFSEIRCNVAVITIMLECFAANA